jgi:hypothetical protein
MIRIVERGRPSGVSLMSGTVETDNHSLEADADLAALSGEAKPLRKWLGKSPWIRSFSVAVSGERGREVRAELRSDGVIFVYVPEPKLAVDAACRVLQTALGVDVEVAAPAGF